MRHYDTNSAQAAARILALTLLANGVVEQRELDSLARSRLLLRLGIEGEEFDQILHEYCEDLLTSCNYVDGLRMLPDPDLMHELLADIRDPLLQAVLLEVMQDIVRADGVESGGEVALLAEAVQQWGMGALGAHEDGRRRTR